jgi:filamentous hemagglutinin
VVLDAGRDILLAASQNTTHSESKNSGNQFSVGVGVSLIGAQNGISLELGASQQKGKENSQSQRNTNSVVHADEQLTVNSGRDTTVKGAKLEGNRVVVNTGRDLLLSSVQDTASYDSKQSSSGVSLSLCIPPLCYGASSGSVSASGENITHDGKSVADQSGIFAGRVALLSPREITRSLTVRLSPLPPHRTKTASTPGRWASAISTTRARPAATATRWRFQAVRVAAEKVKTVT